jgi:hypothetical protein
MSSQEERSAAASSEATLVELRQRNAELTEAIAAVIRSWLSLRMNCVTRLRARMATVEAVD